MLPNLHSVYSASEEHARLEFFGLGALLALGAAAILLLPPVSVVMVTLIIMLMFVTFVHPVVGVLLAGGFQAVVGYGQLIFGDWLDALVAPSVSSGAFWDPTRRVFGTLGTPEMFGIFLMAILLFAVALLFRQKLRPASAYRLSAYVLILMPLLVLTYSWAVWCVFLAGFVLIVLHAAYAHRSRS